MKAHIEKLAAYLASNHSNSRHISLFCKSLYVFLLLKMIYLWPLLADVAAYKTFSFNSILGYFLFTPLSLNWLYPELFMYVFVIILILALALGVNYWLAFLVCWFSISLSRLFLPVINGSDLVLNLFLIIAIFLPARPRFTGVRAHEIQTLIANLALLFGQIQFALIYLLSGHDKLLSAAWRSGAAIDSVNHLRFYHMPFFNVDLTQSASLLLSWSVILFELSFPFLIWLRKCRIPMLILGVGFHLVIIFYLGLADFGLVMILCYGIYLPFKKSKSTHWLRAI